MRLFAAVILAVTTLALLLPTARADDVTLKSGKVYKDLTLVKETAKSYIFLTEKGNRLTLSKSSVASIEKKPTTRGEFIEREKKVDRRDAESLYELAAWAADKGLKKDAKKLFGRVVRLDKNHVKAREALGYRQLDGKWVSKREWEKKRAKELEKEYKARGWIKVKDKWVSPLAHARLKMGLVQHDGHWVTEKQKKKIDKNDLIWFEGTWVTEADRKKMKDGYRQHRGRWMLVEDLDETHESFDDPWILKGEFIEVHTNCRYRDIKKGKMLQVAEGAYSLCQNVFGEEHPDLYEEDKGKLAIVVGKGITTYKGMGHSVAKSDAEAGMSNSYGMFYAAGWGNDRGAAITFRYGELGWVKMWIGMGTAFAFISRTTSWENLDEDLMLAFAGYIAAGHEGAYNPGNWHYGYIINNTKFPLRKATAIISKPRGESPRGGKEHGICRTGFFLHYLRSKADSAFCEYMQGFRGGKGTFAGLVKACVPDLEGDALNQDFLAFTEKYKKDFQARDQ